MLYRSNLTYVFKVKRRRQTLAERLEADKKTQPPACTQERGSRFKLCNHTNPQVVSELVDILSVVGQVRRPATRRQYIHTYKQVQGIFRHWAYERFWTVPVNKLMSLELMEKLAGLPSLHAKCACRLSSLSHNNTVTKRTKASASS